MKRIFPGKHLAIVLLTLGVSVGCASSPKEPAKPSAAQVSQAISDAQASINEANSLKWIWRDTETFLASAKGTADKDPAGALKLANKAKAQADLAINQYYLEHAKSMLKTVSAQGTAQDSTVAAAGSAIRNAEGRKAYDLLKPLVN